jgi:hypothetical protein
MLQEALKLLGFSTPFVYAAATYGLFLYLDKKASGQAKRAISGWLKPLDYDKAAVAAAMVEVFDRLYTRPLLGWRALSRSALFSIIVSLFVLYEILYVLPRASLSTVTFIHLQLWARDQTTIVVLFAALLSNILSDYVSLFFIRKWLTIASRAPFVSLIGGALVGASVIIIVYFLRDIAVTLYLVGPRISLSNIQDYFGRIATPAYFRTTNNIVIWGAFAVHLWLLLFALGVIFLQVSNSFLWAAGKMQWFLKQGENHPLQAVGYVAAVIVFTVTAIGHVVWR